MKLRRYVVMAPDTGTVRGRFFTFAAAKRCQNRMNIESAALGFPVGADFRGQVWAVRYER